MGRSSTKGYDCRVACSGVFWLANEESGDTRATKASGTGTNQTRCCLWTVPEGVYCATFEVWGGGGQGAPACCCTCYGGPPGAPGGYTTKTIAVKPGWQYTLCVGGGGFNNCWNANQINPCSCRGCYSFVSGCGIGSFGCRSFANDCCLSMSCYPCQAQQARPSVGLFADGGNGAGWCNDCSGAFGACTGGWFQSPFKCGCAFGGDINIKGKGQWMLSCHENCILTMGPGAFGAPDQWTGRQCCCYQCGQGRCGACGSCGCCGGFPGGGGGVMTMLGDSHQDGCACAGMGGNGLIKITF